MNKNIFTNDIITYKGKVKLSLLKGDKLYKNLYIGNEGKRSLFLFLIDCLSGNLRESGAPKFINIFDENDQSLITGSSAIPHNKVKKNIVNQTYSVTFTFLIPFSSIVSGGNKQLKKIRLYSNKDLANNYYSAEIILTDPITINSANRMNLLIEWELTLANAS